MVGMVVTISPSFSLYRMVVLPAASRPTMRILISFLPHILSNSFENAIPILAVLRRGHEGRDWRKLPQGDTRADDSKLAKALK